MRGRINCLLSFLYALVRHDCVAALTSIGLDPFVGFLHVDRPNRPSLALDLMQEFRPNRNMLVLMTYDVSTVEKAGCKRLRRVARACEDSLRFYFLDVEAAQRTEHHGVDKPVDLTEPLIL